MACLRQKSAAEGFQRPWRACAHLLLRTITWVENKFGPARASSARREEVNKLALSMPCGTLPGETEARRSEHTIVPILGGSRPHAAAEIEEEGGSISSGTLGALEEGEAAPLLPHDRTSLSNSRRCPALCPLLTTTPTLFALCTVCSPACLSSGVNTST